MKYATDASYYEVFKESERDSFITIACALEQREHGMFAAQIGTAFIYADAKNKLKLVAAFPELFGIKE